MDHFRNLHQPGKPLVLANVWDAASARVVAQLPCPALATASYAIAQAAGVEDDDLTFELNLAAVEKIAKVANEFGKPLTVDWQAGYGDRLEEGIEKLVSLGVVGINLEDYDGGMLPVEVAAERVKRAGKVVVNARTDTLLHGGTIEDAIERGRAYLAAGATTVFVWGSTRGVSRSEVEQLVEGFNGMLNVKVKLDGLSVPELAKIGVARCSVGPTLQQAALKAVEDTAKGLYGLN